MGEKGGTFCKARPAYWQRHDVWWKKRGSSCMTDVLKTWRVGAEVAIWNVNNDFTI